MDNKTENIIGTQINAALALRDVKQKELAQTLSVKDNVVSYWCNGSRTPNTHQIIQIANFLNVSADYLLGLTDTPTELKTDGGKALRICCDYTGLDEKNVDILHRFDDVLVHFVNDMVSFTNENKYTINQFDLSKNLLLNLYDASVFDKICDDADPYTQWKSFNNELLFTNSQFRLQSAFNRYINNDDIVTATNYFDKLENEFIENNIKREKELNSINKIAPKYNYVAWQDWFYDNKEHFKNAAAAKKWLNSFNIIVSDDTLDYIMLMMRH